MTQTKENYNFFAYHTSFKSNKFRSWGWEITDITYNRQSPLSNFTRLNPKNIDELIQYPGLSLNALLEQR